MRQIVSFLSSLDYDAKNLPNGSNVSPFALHSSVRKGTEKIIKF